MVLRLAPAYDAGALNPGCMPLFVALIVATGRLETFSVSQKIGTLAHTCRCAPDRRMARIVLERRTRRRRCPVPIRLFFYGLLHRGAAARETGPGPCSRARLQRIVSDLCSRLSRDARVSPRGGFPRRTHRPGDLPGYRRDDYLPGPYARAVAILGASGAFGLGALVPSAIRIVRHPLAWRMADHTGVDRHRPDLQRGLSGEQTAKGNRQREPTAMKFESSGGDGYDHHRSVRPQFNLSGQ